MGDKVGDKMKQLSARGIAAIRAPGRYRVDDNLSVWAQKKNGKIYSSYLLRYQVEGKRVEKSLGSTSKTTLHDARKKAKDLMEAMTTDQVVPAEQLVKEKRAVADSAWRAEKASLTFREVAEEYIVRVKMPGWKNPYDSAQDWRGRLDKYAYPTIGEMPIDEIRRSHISDVLHPIWLDMHETATRVRSYMQNVFDYALEREYSERANPATQSITKSLPEFTGRTKHLASLHREEAPAVYRALAERSEQSSVALQVIMLTAQRQMDVRKMRWDQIDFDNAVWRAHIAKKSRKQNKFEMDVPLPTQLLETLKRVLQAYDNYETKPTYVFASSSGRGFISEAAMRKELGRLGYTERGTDDPITMHGMRTTFKEWSRFVRADEDEVSELQLTHMEETDTRSAYARDTLLDRRAVLMQQYADYLAA